MSAPAGSESPCKKYMGAPYCLSAGAARSVAADLTKAAESQRRIVWDAGAGLEVRRPRTEARDTPTASFLLPVDAKMGAASAKQTDRGAPLKNRAPGYASCGVASR